MICDMQQVGKNSPSMKKTVEATSEVVVLWDPQEKPHSSLLHL